MQKQRLLQTPIPRSRQFRVADEAKHLVRRLWNRRIHLAAAPIAARPRVAGTLSDNLAALTVSMRATTPDEGQIDLLAKRAEHFQWAAEIIGDDHSRNRVQRILSHACVVPADEVPCA